MPAVVRKVIIGMIFTEQFRRRKLHAKRRVIEFCLSYQEWIEFWGDDIYNRGRGLGKLQMCRYGDKGPYALSNIFKGTHEQNSADKFKNGVIGRQKIITGEVAESVQELLNMGLSTRNIAHLVNCAQKQIMNFKNRKGAYA